MQRLKPSARASPCRLKTMSSLRLGPLGDGSRALEGGMRRLFQRASNGSPAYPRISPMGSDIVEFCLRLSKLVGFSAAELEDLFRNGSPWYGHYREE